VDVETIARLIRILDDGALSPQEGIELIELITVGLDHLKPQVKKWYFRVLIDGIKVTLSELKEHLQEISA
jgi:hypothetical protein